MNRVLIAGRLTRDPEMRKLASGKYERVRPEHIAVAILSLKAGSCYETLKEFSIEPSYVTMLIMESLGLKVLLFM